MSHRPRCPHCKSDLTEHYREIRAEEARRAQAARKTVSRAGGRPRTKSRCPCGKMTVERAEKRGHRC